MHAVCSIVALQPLKCDYIAIIRAAKIYMLLK